MKLTPAQRAALDVLAAAGGEVEAGKRSSRSEPRPYVNMRAAGSLVRMGLARRHYLMHWSPWSPYTHDERYSITDEGRAACS